VTDNSEQQLFTFAPTGISVSSFSTAAFGATSPIGVGIASKRDERGDRR